MLALALVQCSMEPEPQNREEASLSVTEGDESTEDIIIEFSVEDDFADDTIIVVLTHEASMTIQENTVLLPF